MNMKKIFNIITILLLTVFTTSCLDSNLEDLDTYKGKDIIGIAGVYHRYYGSQTIPGSGEQQVLQSALSYDNFQADAETGTRIWVDTSDIRLRKTYKHAWGERQLELQKCFTKSGVDSVSMSTSEDYVKALMKLFKMRA